MGLTAAFLCSIFSSSKDLVSKKLSFSIDGILSIFTSFSFALPFYLVLLFILYLLGEETFVFSAGFFTLVLLRSVTDTLAEGLKMHAFSHGDISLIASFLALSPLFLLVLSPLITGDPLSPTAVAAVILVVAGSVLLVYSPSRPTVPMQRKGILLAVGASFFFALNSCFDRLAVQVASPVLSGFCMTLLSAAILAPLVLTNKERLRLLSLHRTPLTLRGFFEISYMVAKLYALQYLSAPHVVGIQKASLLMSIVGGKVLFKEGQFKKRLAAGILILVGVALIVTLEI